MNNILLDFLSLLAILSSVLVITSKNPVIAVIFLISLFINTAIYLILLGIGFVGISYIIIYCGAITVLFLFVILMLNIRLIDILEVGNEYTKNLPLAFFVGVLFIAEIFSILPFTTNNLTFIDLFLELYHIFSPVSGVQNSIDLSPSIFITYAPDFIVGNFTQIASLGQGLYTYGAMWLIVVSLILLLAMVAAIQLTSFSQAGTTNNNNNNS